MDNKKLINELNFWCIFCCCSMVVSIVWSGVWLIELKLFSATQNIGFVFIPMLIGACFVLPLSMASKMLDKVDPQEKK